MKLLHQAQDWPKENEGECYGATLGEIDALMELQLLGADPLDYLW